MAVELKLFSAFIFAVYLLDFAAPEKICSFDGGYCSFPFEYGGVTYDGDCAPAKNPMFDGWCRTTPDSSDWSYCLRECPSKTTVSSITTAKALNTSKTTATEGPAADFMSTPESEAESVEATGVTKVVLTAEDEDNNMKENEESDDVATPQPPTAKANITQPKPKIVASTATVAVKLDDDFDAVTENDLPHKGNVCTSTGEKCEFPFSYGGVQYSTCVTSLFKSQGWCYTDVSAGLYTDCIPCPELPSIQPPTTSTPAVTSKKGRSKKVTEVNSVKKPVTEVETDSADGEDEPGGISIGIVIVIILSILFAIVLVVMIYLHIMKLRRSREGGDSDSEENKKEGSAEGLLHKNSNGNHENGVQEMRPLTARAKGDFDVIDENAAKKTTISV